MQEKQDAVMHQAVQRFPGLAESIVDESGYYVSDEERDRVLKTRNLAQELNPYLLSRLNRWERQQSGWFQAFHGVGDENVGYYMEEQLSDRDKAAIRAAGRKPYEFNILTPYINGLCGEEIAQRYQWKVVPLNAVSAQEQYAEGANHYLNWVRQAYDNQWDQTGSMVFRDNLVRGGGVAGVTMDPYNPFGAVKIDHHRFPEFMWDLSSARDGSLKDVRYLWRGYYEDRMTLAYKFKGFREEIMGYSPRLAGTAGVDYAHTVFRPKVRGLTNGNGYASTWNPMAELGIGEQLFVREWYYRRRLPKWRIIDGNTDQPFYFDREDQAADAAVYLYNLYLKNPQMLEMAGAQTPLISRPMPYDMTIIDQYIFIGDMLVSIVSNPTDRMPYKFLMTDHYEGSTVSHLERGKGRQRFLNKIIQEIEKIAGSAKPQVGINKAFLSGQETDDEIRANAVKSDHLWLFDSNDPNFKIGDSFATTPAVQAGPMLLPLMQIVQQSIEQTYGGSSVTGTPDYSGQSAKSQLAMKMNHRTTTMSIFDKYRYFGQQVGEDAIYLSQYLEPVVRMAVMDESGATSIKSFTDFGIQSIGDLKFSIRVVEEVVNPSERDRRMQDLMALAGQIPDAAEDMMDLLLKYSSVDYSDKVAIIQQRDARRKMQSQMAQEQMAMEKEKLANKHQIDMGRLLNESRGLDIEATKLSTPTISLSGKINELGNRMAASLVTAATGMEAHPAVIAQDSAEKMLINQSAVDLAQQRSNELMTPAQRTLIEAKAAQIKNSMLSQQDKSNRDLKQSS